MTAIEHRVCRARTPEERKAVAEAAQRRAVRYPIPRRYDAEGDAAMVAITARLRPFAESPTMRSVVLTFWAEGVALPLSRATVSSDVVGWWRTMVPVEATYMTIEG